MSRFNLQARWGLLGVVVTIVLPVGCALAFDDFPLPAGTGGTGTTTTTTTTGGSSSGTTGSSSSSSTSSGTGTSSTSSSSSGGCGTETQCGTGCKDLTTDPDNCGTCGHGCLGGSCVGSTCQPVVVTSGQGSPAGIAVDSTYVYWTAMTGGTVNKAPKTGGSIVPIATGQADPLGVAVDSANVYWTNNGTPGAVMMAPLAGGAPAPSPRRARRRSSR